MSVINTLLVYLSSHKEKIVRFFVATILSASISIGFAYFLKEEIGTPAEVAVAISLFTAFVFNFFTMRYFVFKSKSAAMKQLVHFGVSSGVFRLAEYIFFYIIYDVIGWHYLICLIISLGTSFVIKYLYHAHITFKDT